MGAITGRADQVPLPTTQVIACTAATYTAGRFVAGTNQSTAYSLGPSKCTEFAYAIETSGATLGKTYRLRLFDSTHNQALTSYVAYPTLTIRTSMIDIPRISKEGRGGFATSSLDFGGDVGLRSSIAIGSDGFPVISCYDNSNGNLNFLKCNDTSCSSYATSSLDSAGNVGYRSSIAIGTDGFAVVSYQDVSNAFLRFAKCNNLACSAPVTSSLDTGSIVGEYSSIAIGSDSFPVVSYYDNSTGLLKFAKCNDASCVSKTLSTIDGSFAAGLFNSIAIGSDGFPVISYRNNNINDLMFAKCSNVSCSAVATSTLDAGGNVGNQTSIVIGSDGFPAIAYQDTTNGNLNFAHCSTISCSAFSSTTLESAGDVGYYTSLAIGTDGFPAISYYDFTNGNLNFTKCANVFCTSFTASTLDAGANQTGQFTSLAIGTDGFPVISYYESDASLLNLNFIKCNNSSCAPNTSSSANLPTTNIDLDTYLDDAGYTNITTSDNLYDSVSGATSTRLAYEITHPHGNNTEGITLSWEGQLSVATATYLQIYNRTSSLWETLVSSLTPTANTDFTLSGMQSTSLGNYYDSSNNVSSRVVTGTTTQSTILKTDVFSLSAVASIINLIHYRWRQDDGDEVAANYSAAEDTAVPSSSNLYLGDRRRLRLTVSNAGSASASNITYRLEYASSSCTTWLPVPGYNLQTTEEWATDLSGYLPEAGVTTHSSGMTVPAGKTFTSGQARLFTNQTTAHTLTSTEYTEHEFGIRSTSFAQSNLVYCFRLSNAGSLTNFVFTVQPQATLNPNPRPQYGGTGSDPTGTGTPHAGGIQNGGATTTDITGGGTPRGGGGQGGGGGDSG